MPDVNSGSVWRKDWWLANCATQADAFIDRTIREFEEMLGRQMGGRKFMTDRVENDVRAALKLARLEQHMRKQKNFGRRR